MFLPPLTPPTPHPTLPSPHPTLKDKTQWLLGNGVLLLKDHKRESVAETEHYLPVFPADSLSPAAWEEEEEDTEAIRRTKRMTDSLPEGSLCEENRALMDRKLSSEP